MPLIRPFDAMTVKSDGCHGEQGDIEGQERTGVGMQYEVVECGKMI
jgi:hypothetical protein